MNRPLYMCGCLTNCLIVSSQTGRLRVNSTYILGDSPGHRDSQILKTRILFTFPATVEPDLIAALSRLQKLLLSLDFTMEMRPIRLYIGVFFSFIGLLWLYHYHFDFLMILKETRHLLPSCRRKSIASTEKSTHDYVAPTNRRVNFFGFNITMYTTIGSKRIVAMIYRSSVMPLCHYAVMSLRRYAVMPLCRYAVMPLCRYAVMPLCRYAVIQDFTYGEWCNR